MLEIKWDLEVIMIIPYYYMVDDNDNIEPNFQKIMDRLNIQMNIPWIIENIDKAERKSSEISVYFSDNSYGNFILIDSEIGLDDQLDLIHICIRCTAENGGIIRHYAHEFYAETCEYNIIYSEGNYVICNEYGIDFSKFSPSFDDFMQNTTEKRIDFYQSGVLIKSVQKGNFYG